MKIHIILLLFISFLGAVIYRRGATREKNRNFVYLAFLSIFLVQSLRGIHVGWDTYRYYTSFRRININSYGSMVANWEPFYVLLNKLTGLFTDNAQVLLAVVSFVIDAGVVIFILNNTEDDQSAFWPVFFWMVFTTYVNSMNTLRQSLAMAFTMNIYTVLRKYPTKKGYLISVVLLWIGFMFHNVSLACVLIIFAFLLKWERRNSLVVSGILMLGIIFLSAPLVSFTLRLFPKYEKYQESAYLTGTEVGGYYIGLCLVRIFLVFIVYWLNIKDRDTRRSIYILSFFMILSVGLYIMKSRVMIASRLVYYFEIFQCIYIPMVLRQTRGNKIMLYGLIYIMGWIVFLYMIHTPDGARGCVPYAFFWE